MKRAILFACLICMPLLAPAQTLRLDQLEHLAAKATDTVNVTLDASLLQMAAKFLDSDDPDSAEIKKLVAGLKGISVRSYGFKNDGEYLVSDVEGIRSQLHDPEWKRVVETRSKVDGDSDVYVRTLEGKIVGLTIIAAEPRELTIVSINGSIDPDGIRRLGGNFGIPKLNFKKSTGKDKDE